MYVVEEWLSSTEPGLQIDSPLFLLGFALAMPKNRALLTSYFNFQRYSFVVIDL